MTQRTLIGEVLSTNEKHGFALVKHNGTIWTIRAKDAFSLRVIAGMKAGQRVSLTGERDDPKAPTIAINAPPGMAA